MDITSFIETLLWLSFPHLPLDKVLDGLEKSAIEPSLRQYSHIPVGKWFAPLHSKPDIPVCTAKAEGGFKKNFESTFLKRRDTPVLRWGQ